MNDGNLYGFSFNNKRRKCVVCGKSYKPKSPSAKYCKKCRELVKKERYRLNNLRLKRKEHNG